MLVTFREDCALILQIFLAIRYGNQFKALWKIAHHYTKEEKETKKKKKEQNESEEGMAD